MSDIYRDYPIEPYAGGNFGGGGSMIPSTIARRLLTGRFSAAAFRDTAIELALTHGTKMAWSAVEPRTFAVFEATLVGDKHREFVKMISHGMETSIITRQMANDGQACLVPPRYTMFRYEGALFFASSTFRINTTVKLYTLRKNTKILNKLCDKYFGGNGSKMLRTVTDRTSRQSLVRPLNTVIVTPDVQHNVLDAIEKWWTGKDEYARLGRQWKITICLRGVPGCGKSSLERAVAGHYGGDMRVVNCASIDDAGLYEALRCNERVVVLEEFYPPGEMIEETVSLDEELVKSGGGDMADLSEMKISKRKKTNLTLPGCLAAFDGADVIHDKIIFINTNYPKKFPAKLRRPGRIDVFQEMPLPGDKEIKEGFFPLYFPDTPFTRDVTFEPRSGGRIQKCLDLCNNNPDTFIDLVLQTPPAEEDES